jgi:cation diffusion facilitator family transporter
MSKSNSTKAVFAALTGNALITLLKFIAAFFTKSTSMMAEAIHSSADCLNQIFLLVGNKRTNKDNDENHPFGYGREEFFWAFMVAILLFFGGAAFSIYEGIEKLSHPEPIKHFWWAISVLGISVLIEAKSFKIAYDEMKKTSGKGLLKSVKDSIDINLVVIILEDAAALLGLSVALVCTILSLINPIFDALGSIAIGIILCYVSYSLVNELRKLIIGESMPREERSRIKQILYKFDMVNHVNRVKTMTMGQNKYLVLISINAEDFVRAHKIEDTVEEMKKDIINEFPNIGEIFVEISEN